ncbi:ABC transporter ATP-binding protein [Niastella vici]|uniref:ABC transporter ATP-binding protein n=1 Tax=Niastella vici TaxID=1703345 RepID=A0A1V9FZH3_9BACT|nr:ATP-binding cassette domain-containing protein [Niastella vici]OQP63769.1 ABC transporter ATP-binding protein [Niastella vici]
MREQTLIQAEKEKETGRDVMVVKHLFKSFGSNKVLNDFNLTLGNGENLVVLGKSGSGKSVLIKCIIGLLTPESGIIEVLGQQITDLDHDELDKVRAKIGFLFQSNALYDSMTVRQNLEFPLRRHWMQVTQQEVDQLVQEALEDVGLAHTINMMPAELSGGMRKRIALARTLILKPEIILYDEPTTGLDPITGKEIIQLIMTIQKKYRSSSVIISHDMNCVRLAADRIVVLIDGRCYAQGTYDELKRNGDPVIHQFFE